MNPYEQEIGRYTTSIQERLENIERMTDTQNYRMDIIETRCHGFDRRIIKLEQRWKVIMDGAINIGLWFLGGVSMFFLTKVLTVWFA